MLPVISIPYLYRCHYLLLTCYFSVTPCMSIGCGGFICLCITYTWGANCGWNMYEDFTCTHNLLFYINCVYLVVCMGDNSTISVAYIRTKSQIPSADGSLVIPLKKLKKKRKTEETLPRPPAKLSFQITQKILQCFII